MESVSIEVEASDYILFFKLYFLGRWSNYINYMEGAKLLAEWIFPDESNSKWQGLDKNVTEQLSPIFCGNCFKEYSSEGSSFTISCNSCGRAGNMAYEIQQLGFLLKTPWNLTCWLATRAIAELIRDNNNIDLMRRILYGNNDNGT